MNPQSNIPTITSGGAHQHGIADVTGLQTALDNAGGGGGGIVNVLDGADVDLTTPAEGDLLTLGPGGTTVVNRSDVTLEMAANTVLLGQGVGSAPIAGAFSVFISALALKGCLPVFDPAPADGTYYFTVRAPYALTINSFTADVDSGTMSVVVKINGTDVTGLAGPVAVSSTKATTNATAANTVAAGDEITYVVSSASTPVNFRGSLNFTRTGI